MTMARTRGEKAVEQLEELLGQQVRTVRRSRGLTQQEVAEFANTSLGSVRNLEAGSGATTRTLARVLRALEAEQWLGTLHVAKPAFNPLDLVPKDSASRPNASRRGEA
jgi:transcriptional regulator with XRE-family HTH domain